MVHHPYTLLDLVDVLTPLVPIAATAQASPAGKLMDEVLANYGIGRLFGMPIIEDGNIDTTTFANTAKGGVFATGEGGSIILATALEWDTEPERDASLRATELNITGEYGVGEYLAGWIVTMNHDATLPA